MTWFGDFYSSALGKKVVMALTGVVLFGWITAHMLGNMKLFLGAEALNHYAKWLRIIGTPLFPDAGILWVTRIILIVAVWLHIQAAVQLTIMNRKARPIAYSERDYVDADYASRTMRWSGVILILFVIYHLMHLTWGTAHPNFIHGDVHHNVVSGLQVLWVSLFYIVAQICLGLHLFHGLWSMFQSLGWSHPRFNRWRRYFATTFAVVIALGNISFPIAILAGVVK